MRGCDVAAALLWSPDNLRSMDFDFSDGQTCQTVGDIERDSFLNEDLFCSFLYFVMDLLNELSSDSEDGGAQLQNNSLQVNKEYARKFEHNKKREERQKRE